MRLSTKHITAAISASLLTHLCGAALFGVQFSSQLLEQKTSEQQELFVSRIALVGHETPAKMPSKAITTPSTPKRVTTKPKSKQKQPLKIQQNHLSLGIKKTESNSTEIQATEMFQSNELSKAQQEQARVSYEQLLVAWIEKHKRYPDKALRRGFQGQARLKIKIGKSGELLNFELESSSGLTVLDQEVLSLAERAAPYPKPNQGVTKLDFIVPIQFRLR